MQFLLRFAAFLFFFLAVLVLRFSARQNARFVFTLIFVRTAQFLPEALMNFPMPFDYPLVPALKQTLVPLSRVEEVECSRMPDTLFAHLSETAMEEFLALLDACFDPQRAPRQEAWLLRQKEWGDRPAFWSKGEFPWSYRGYAMRRPDFGGAFVDVVVGAGFVAVALFNHGRFMIGAAYADGGGGRSDAIGGIVELAYPAGDGTNGALEQRHEYLVGVVALSLVLIDPKHSVRAHGNNSSVLGHKVNLAILFGVDGLPFVDFQAVGDWR